MWAQQMYDVTDVDFDNATKVTLNFTMAGSNNYRLGAWIYPDADVTTNANDRKVSFVINVDGKAYTVEQYMYKGANTLSNGHELVYFDLTNIEQYGKEKTPVIYITKGTNLTVEEKTALGEKIAAMESITLSNVGFTLIGTDATDFTIFKMGSAATVNTLMDEYGIDTAIRGIEDSVEDVDSPAYNLGGVRATKGLLIKKGKKYIK